LLARIYVRKQRISRYTGLVEKKRGRERWELLRKWLRALPSAECGKFPGVKCRIGDPSLKSVAISSDQEIWRKYY